MLRNRSLLVILLALLMAGFGCSADTPPPQLKPYDFSYSSYARFLKDNVAASLVDYSSVLAERTVLDELVEAVGEADLGAASANQKMAFYINAYNILTIRSIIDAYPVSSIKDIDGVWDDERWPVAGVMLTLNQIEHEVLRKEFKEPRIHVAVNCASISCPPLSDVPFYPDSLDIQLERAARNFAGDASHNRIDTETRTAYLSEIFDWFGDDFVSRYYTDGRFDGLSKKESASLSFIIAHLPIDPTSNLPAGIFEVEYFEYDWSLNETR